MARVTLHGFTEMERALQKMATQRTVDGICKRSIYEGAEIIADEMSAAIDKIPRSNNWAKGLSSAQALDLKEAFGITTMRNQFGVWNCKVGFTGYNRYGQPNVLLARAWDGGSSINDATHVFTNAIKSARKAAESQMGKRASEDFQNVMNRSFGRS